MIDRPAVRTLDDLKAAAREARERGFKAVKTNLLVFDEKGGRQFTPGSGAGPGFPSSTSPEDMLDALIEQLTALREGAGRAAHRSISISTTRPRVSAASPRRSNRSS